jgi:hypothetical protein
MNDQLIESLLRKAPAPKPPPDLEEKLIAGIRLPRRQAQRPAWNAATNWIQRWFPRLSIATVLLACLAVIGAQINQLAKIHPQNETLRAQTQNLAQLREANAEVQRLRNENAQLDRLRKDDAELQRLRIEVLQLRAQAQELAQLRAENQRLQAANMPAPAAQSDFFGEQKARAEWISCINNLKQLGLALHVWANDHDGRFPADFLFLTNVLQLASCKVLQCPGDKSHHVTNWAQAATGDVSYLLYTAGLTDRDNRNIVAAECPIHHNILLLDGSVQALDKTGKLDPKVHDPGEPGWPWTSSLKIIDGRKVFAP